MGWPMAAAVLVVAVSVRVAPGIRAGDWPMWRYDAGHTAASPDALPSELRLQWIRQYSPRTPAWEDPLNQDLMSFDRVFEPVVSGGQLFVGFNDTDKVVALDVATGQPLWAFYADGPVRLAPAVWNDRVYFTSDDGYLYCLDARDGRLLWRVRGGPSDRKALGNGRVISAWPARGGPVVRDGVVYFAASIWPFMGTFLYAVDGEGGDVLWRNDGTGSQFLTHPHGAPAFGGVAPQGQLVATEHRVLVPGGRTCPAVLDRQTGQLLHFAFGGKGQGGSFVAAGGGRYYVHTRGRGTMAFDLETGEDAGFRLNEPVLDGDFVYAANTPGGEGERAAPAVVQAFDQQKQLVWQVEADGSGDLIKAGPRLYAAGGGAIVAIDPPQDDAPAAVAWSVTVEGHVRRLLAAADRLFAVTREGQIMAFGADHPEEPAVLTDPVEPVEPRPAAAAAAERLLRRAGNPEGYALWFGLDDPALLEAVLAQAPLHGVAVDPAADRVNRFRRKADRAGWYGSRVAIHQADPAGFQAPPYVAELVVVSPSLASRCSEPQFLRRVYQSVRPYGGVLWIAASGSRGEVIREALDAAALPKARIAACDEGICVVRRGPLPGSAPWTHTYGDVANTVTSKDGRVKLPLGLLWFGGHRSADILPRHSHGPSPQVVGGRLFIEGMRSIHARDVYTGRELWVRSFDDLGTYGVYYDDSYTDDPLSTAYSQLHIPGANLRGANYVAAAEGVYVVVGSQCHRLDPATGETVRTYALPADGGEDPPEWGFVGRYEDLLLAGVGFADYSRRLGYQYEASKKRGPAWSPDHAGSLGLLAFDCHSGRIRWRVTARHSFLHNGIVAGGGRIYCLDKLPKRVEEQLRRRGTDDPATYRIVALDAATGAELWETREPVFGTWLAYSEPFDVLLQAGAAASDRSPDEAGTGMAVFQARDGSLLWHRPDLAYAGPCMIHHQTIITNTTSYKESQGALDLLDGSPVLVDHPLTGKPQPWRFTRTYGCNTAVASQHLLTFRSGAAGFYDLAGHSGTGNIGGFKSGCSSNLIVADGVLNAPEYTRTCSCSYQNQTSLALVPMPENEVWTYSLLDAGQAVAGRIVRIGINLGAPGDRRSETGTLWLDHPSVGGVSPELDVQLEGRLRWFQHHSSRVTGPALAWVAASGVEGLRGLSLRLERAADPADPPPGRDDPSGDQKAQAPGGQAPTDADTANAPDADAAGAADPPGRSCTVRLYFVEPDQAVRPGERVFDVVIQGKTVLENLDVVRRAGGPFHSLAETISAIPVGRTLVISLVPKTAKEPVLCGVEVVETGS